MKRFASLVFLVAVAIPAAGHGATRFKGGSWFDGTRFVAREFCAVDGVLRATCAESAAVVDLSGMFVVPPLADAHHHALAVPEPAEDIRRFLSAGVFYVRNPNSIARFTAEARKRLNQAESVDVIFSNGGITSPGGHPVQIYSQHVGPQIGWKPEEFENEAWVAAKDEADLVAKWPGVLEKKPDFIKAYLENAETPGSRGLSPEVLRRVVALARTAGLEVTVHVASAADFRFAVDSGAAEISHLPIEKISSADAKEAARRGTRVVTTTLSHRVVPAGIDEIYRHNLTLLRGAGVTIVAGTDDQRLVIDELENLRRLGVFTDRELLEMGTVTTPRSVFPSRKIARLAEGNEASFLALRANPSSNISALREIAVRVKQGHVIPDAALQKKPSIVDAIGHTLLRDGAAAGIEEYRRLRREKPEAYDFSEQQLNAFGYRLIQMQRVPDAIEVFRLNAEMFPASANVYDSLGEAYALAGEEEKAIRNYERSLELNPKNDNARAWLAKLRKQTE